MPTPPAKPFKIEPPHYPIVYVRGYAMRNSEREEVFNDAYYGFAATSVEKRQAPAPKWFEADIFEGQFIRFMKLKDYGYADPVNRGLEIFHANPSRSLWICRFYDQDYIRERTRSIETHAEELHELVCKTIPTRLRAAGVDLGANDKEYKVILIAHSMGGLVCRTLIQNLLPHDYGEDPKRWIHRFVTIATPHKGIDLGRIPDFLENFITEQLNPFDANIFKEARMREYLKLGEHTGTKKDPKYRYDINSLGSQNEPFSFPVKRCLCLVGSDFSSYGATKTATGTFSDGLVKQDRAYIVAGDAAKDPGSYSEDMRAYSANVHRAHSGYRGIVNSYESFENIQRFLFGNIRAQIGLTNLSILTPIEPHSTYFYDIEFLLSIRGTGVYLHRREQDPCENAIRLERGKIPSEILLHTGFMNSRLKENPDQGFSHFALTLRVIERRKKDRMLWDSDYPARPIFTETLEVRIGDSDPKKPGDEVQYRWLSDLAGGEGWQDVEADANGSFQFDLRAAESCSGNLIVRVWGWPDLNVTHDQAS